MSSAPEQPRLTIEVGGARLSLQVGHTYRVGRAEECELRLNHATINAHHASIECREDGVWLKDLGSSNGTQVEGSRIDHEVLVVPGQKFQFGAIEGKLVDRAAEPMPIPMPTIDPKLRFRDATFAELMADEMRRVPWFTLSAVIHLIAFVILYVLFEERPIGPERERTLTLLEDQQVGEQFLEFEQEDRTEIEEETEVVAELSLDPLDDTLNPMSENGEDERFEDDLEFDEVTGPLFSGGEHWLRTVKGSKDNILGSAEVSSGGFGKTVSSMRRSGLEIVFVFDSTGSMASILNGTKERIAHMAEMLHALVPDSRIGVVTYRDRDPEEEYLTRKVPLGRDFYRSINFMKVISADGGGTRPEAILDGLREAFGLEWSPGARRVVVLIGDAPAHDFDQRKLDGAVRSFVATQESSVHAIVTSPFGSENLGADTTESFRRIAEHGNGECIAFEDESLVLQQVLSLAFGQEYRKNLDEVSRLVAERRSRVETFALDMVRREDFAQIEKYLRKQPVSDEIVKALSRSQSKAVAQHLVDLMSRPGLPESTRQAAAHALTLILNGQLERAVTRVLLSSVEKGRDARKPPWELGVLTSRGQRMLRRAIDEL